MFVDNLACHAALLYTDSNIQYEPVLHAWWVVRILLWLQGILGHTLSPVRQLFERIASPSAAADAESRFQHFKKHVWLRIKESGSSGNTCCYLCKQLSRVALVLCLFVLRCTLLCCRSLLDFAGCLLRSSPCKHAVHAAFVKDAMFSPVAFSISTGMLSTNGKPPV